MSAMPLSSFMKTLKNFSFREASNFTFSIFLFFIIVKLFNVVIVKFHQCYCAFETLAYMTILTHTFIAFIGKVIQSTAIPLNVLSAFPYPITFRMP